MRGETMTTQGKMAPAHPGEHIKEDFLDPLGITPYRLAKKLGVPVTRITRIINGQTRISVDTAMRLSRFFGNSAQFWLNLQSDYELQVAEDAGDVFAINQEVQPYSA